MALLVISLEAKNKDCAVMREIGNLVDGYPRIRSRKYLVAETRVSGIRFGSSGLGKSCPIIFRITKGSHMNIAGSGRFHRLAQPRF